MMKYRGRYERLNKLTITFPWYRYWMVGYGGFYSGVLAHPEKGAIFVSMDLAQRIILARDIRRYLENDPWHKCFIEIDGEPYAGFWGDGVFNNPVNRHFPRGGYFIKEHWSVHNMAYRKTFKTNLKF